MVSTSSWIQEQHKICCESTPHIWGSQVCAGSWHWSQSGAVMKRSAVRDIGTWKESSQITSHPTTPSSSLAGPQTGGVTDAGRFTSPLQVSKWKTNIKYGISTAGKFRRQKVLQTFCMCNYPLPWHSGHCPAGIFCFDGQRHLYVQQKQVTDWSILPALPWAFHLERGGREERVGRIIIRKGRGTRMNAHNLANFLSLSRISISRMWSCQQFAQQSHLQCFK